MTAEPMKRPLAGADPIGPFSPGLEIGPGRLVVVSGQGPWRHDRLELGSIEEETRLTIENVGDVLASAGLGFEHVVRCGVFLADLGDFERMNRVYEEFFPAPRPTRTTVGAALLNGIKVEIDAMAVAPPAP
jgi:2-iminobutanoate/2-iminopropanoate deaminase